MMQRIPVLVLLCILPTWQAFSQSGGTHTYQFLGLTNSARVAALGGKNISIRDDDLNLAFHNPALLSKSMHNHMVLNYVNYFAGIHYGYVAYALDQSFLGPISGGIHFIDYGSFTGTDPTGNVTGDFRAAEYSLNLSWSRKIDSLLTFGITMKQVYSFLERYRSFGMAVDLGLNYYNSDHEFSASLVLSNLGSQLKGYYRDASREPLPFELMAGLTKKLEHAPFRFSILFHQLETFPLRTKPRETALNSSEGEIPENLAQKLSEEFMSHLIAGVEFIPSQNFFLSLGYNYLRRQQLKLAELPGTVGFSWGFGLRIKKFHVSYGRATYHLAGASNHFSISANLSAFGTLH
jgi:hypothetical protein